jgi:hypothetical protein
MPSTAAAGYKDLLEGKLLAGVSTSTTTGITLKVKQVNGATPTWTTIAHRVKVIQRTATNNKAELWDVAAGTSQSGTTVTLGTVTRALSLTDGTSFAATGTAQSFAAGADVFLSWDAHDAAQTPKLDIANSFAANQTITSTNELRFADSATAIWDDGSDLNFKSSAQSVRTLSQLASLSGSNDKVKITSNDTTESYLASKLTAGDGLTATETNDGSNETLDLDIELASDPGLEFSSAALRAKIKSAGGITRDSNGLSVNTSEILSVSGLYGDGSDGAKLISSSENLNPGGEFEYTTFTLDAGQTMSVTAVNDPLIIKATGDVTINGTIDLNAKGGAGGTGGAGATTDGAGTNGTAGTAGASIVSGIVCPAGALGAGGAGGGANPGAGGGGGASIFTTGGTGSGTGGGAGGTKPDAALLAWLSNISRNVICGGGGGGGGGGAEFSGSGDGGTGGVGGEGGGAMAMFVGGNLTLGASSVIRCNGVQGTAAANVAGYDGGDGGSGAGGTVLILVRGTITNGGVTATAAGGAAQDGAGSGGTGGAGGNGRVLIYSLTTGTLVSA